MDQFNYWKKRVDESKIATFVAEDVQPFRRGRKAFFDVHGWHFFCFLVSVAEYAFFHEGDFSIPTGSTDHFF